MAFVVAIADSCAWDVSHDLLISTAFARVSSKYGTFSCTFVSHLGRASTKHYATPYHVVLVCEGAGLDWDGKCFNEFLRRFGRSLNIAVKFENGKDRIGFAKTGSGVDVSFEAIVEGWFLLSSDIFL